MRVAPAVLVLLLLAPATLAGNAPADASFDFADATGYNTQKKMARAADGSLYYTYVAPADGGDGTEVVVVRERGGERVELPRPTAARGDVSRPTLALDGEGALHLAWTERAEDDREVFHARLDGERWVDARQLSGGLGYAGFPSLATDPEGRLHVAWYGFDGNFYQTFYRRHDEAGWAPAEQLSSGNLDANNPSVVVDEAGGVHVAWYKSDGRRYHIWYAHRPPGEDWEIPRRLSSGEGEAFNAALAVDAAGRVHAVWDELHADGFHVRHVARSTGGEWGAIATLAQGDIGGEYPAIARWGDGVLVAWSSSANATLYATDLTGAPRALLGGATGRHPSLRGPQPWPESERVERLDILWTAPAEGGHEVRHVALAPACSPWEPAERCILPATPAGPREPREAPLAPAALLVAAALGALLRRRPQPPA